MSVPKLLQREKPVERRTRIFTTKFNKQIDAFIEELEEAGVYAELAAEALENAATFAAMKLNGYFGVEKP